MNTPSSKKQNPRSRARPGAVEAGDSLNLTKFEIETAKKLIEHAMQPRVLPAYSAEERFVLSILAANLSRQQQARGKKSKGDAKEHAEHRRNHVNLLLRYVVEKRYRQNPNTNATVMKIIDWLDGIGIEASEPQVRRDIHAVIEQGPLPNW
jgi:DNA-binding helix-hairpin-helix protein with protein kinase domain